MYCSFLYKQPVCKEYGYMFIQYDMENISIRCDLILYTINTAKVHAKSQCLYTTTSIQRLKAAGLHQFILNPSWNFMSSAKQLLTVLI